MGNKRYMSMMFTLLLLCCMLTGCRTTTDFSEEIPLPAAAYTLDVSDWNVLDIASGRNDRLFIAASDTVEVRDPMGNIMGHIEDAEGFVRIACSGGELYAVMGEPGAYTLAVYDENTLEEKRRLPLALNGSIQRMNALRGYLMLASSLESEGQEYGEGWLVDVETAELKPYSYAAMANWGAPLGEDRILLGESFVYTGSYEETGLSHLYWSPLSEAGCTMQDDGAAYYVSSAVLGLLDMENAYALSCMVLDGEFCYRLAGGSDMLYALDYEGKITCIPESALKTEPETVIHVALATGMPTQYLTICMKEYMTENPGVLIRTSSTDPFTLRNMLLAGSEKDSVDIYVELLSNLNTYSYIRSGSAEDLSEYPQIMRWVGDERAIDGVLRGMMYREGLYGIPECLSVPGMQVHEDKWRQAGYEVPASDWTWSELLHLVLDHPGEEPLLSYDKGENWPVFMADYLASYGDPENKTVDFDTDVFRELMPLWRECCREGSIKDVHSHEEPYLAEKSLDIFAADAISPEGVFYESQDYPYIYVSRPVFGGEVETRWSMDELGNIMFLYSRSDVKTEAADFLAYCMSYDQKHRHSIAMDESILYEIHSADDYGNQNSMLDEAVNVAMKSRTEIFLERGYAVYASALPRLALPSYDGELMHKYQADIMLYMADRITLDELIARLTETAEMMLR